MGVPARLRPAPATEVAAALARRQQDAPDPDDEPLLVRHYLALLVGRHPGASVEVRVPPYAAVQCVAGARHTRGTPPAVVETDAVTWIELCSGERDWAAAVSSGRLVASGQRSDLSPLLDKFHRPANET